ncbi:heavy-metal-associated domain-containing protein [Thermanaerovibrio acidaminovorans]|uniref:heavy-metal-associated domain-containing protein n=1 Tax=Thermanaerovibrio acidaminovorans TaxID=81462 RepID=UPI002491052F|nr:heavy-metal-associated domain-containing protein [Thermanaerovibrio acidaminovorans]
MITLKVDDMSCEHCVRRITDALKSAGIQGFTVDLSSKSVSLASEGDVERAVEALEGAGYPSRVA